MDKGRNTEFTPEESVSYAFRGAADETQENKETRSDAVTEELGEQVREIVRETKREIETGEEENPLPDFDFHDEMIQIEMLFQSHILSFGYKEYTLENYADKRCFSEWRSREGCADTDEMRAGLNIDGILRSGNPSESEVLTYLQYVINIAELCRRSFNREDAQGYDFDIRNYTQLLSRVRDILKKLHYDYRYVDEKEFIFILPHDVTMDAAIPDRPFDPLYGAITEYRSTSAAGNLVRKRELLTRMGSAIESYPDNLKNGNNLLYSRIEFLLNHVNIRYDNFEGEERIERVASMSPSELEDWYDETYRMLLVRILSHESLERIGRVDQLASECGTGIEEVTEEEIASILKGFENQSAEAVETGSARSAERLYREETQLVPADSPKPSGSKVIAKVVVAVIAADICFLLFLMYYFHLF